MRSLAGGHRVDPSTFQCPHLYGLARASGGEARRRDQRSSDRLPSSRDPRLSPQRNPRAGREATRYLCPASRRPGRAGIETGSRAHGRPCRAVQSGGARSARLDQRGPSRRGRERNHQASRGGTTGSTSCERGARPRGSRSRRHRVPPGRGRSPPARHWRHSWFEPPRGPRGTWLFVSEPPLRPSRRTGSLR